MYILRGESECKQLRWYQITYAMTFSVAKFFKEASLPLGQARPTFPPPFPVEGEEVSAGVGEALGVLEAFVVALGVLEALAVALEVGAGDAELAFEVAAAPAPTPTLTARLLEGLCLQRLPVLRFLFAMASC